MKGSRIFPSLLLILLVALVALGSVRTTGDGTAQIGQESVARPGAAIPVVTLGGGDLEATPQLAVPAPAGTVASPPPRSRTAGARLAEGADATHPAAPETEQVAPTLRATITPPTDVTALPEPTIAPSFPISRALGLSTGGWPIDVYQFGDGPRALAFLGGIHGGYEWNTILLAYQAIDHFSDNPELVPDNTRLYIIPAANPDGQALIVGHGGRFAPDEVPSETFPGRFNENGVDLNRNWDCGWEATGFWGSREVSGGEAPFSEVETQLLSRFLTEQALRAAVFWHSAAPGVYFGECATPFAAAEGLARIFAAASGYPFYEGFNDYSVTGAASDWLALQGIPAIAVELTNHTSIDWPQNLAGMLAVIRLYSASEPAPGPTPAFH
jgi:protein MpaA